MVPIDKCVNAVNARGFTPPGFREIYKRTRSFNIPWYIISFQLGIKVCTSGVKTVFNFVDMIRYRFNCLLIKIPTMACCLELLKATELL